MLKHTFTQYTCIARLLHVKPWLGFSVRDSQMSKK